MQVRIKRVFTSLLAIGLLGSGLVTSVAAEDSESDVGFRAGSFEISPTPCPNPTNPSESLRDPNTGDIVYPDTNGMCPDENGNWNVPANEFFVPNFDFGQHVNQVGVARTFYAIPAQGTNRFLYGNLGQLDATDITGRTVTSADAADTVGHFLQLVDARGNFAGWHVAVQRTEFTSTETDPTSPLYGHELLGVDLIFHDITAFGIATPASQIVGNLAIDLSVPVAGPSAGTAVVANALPNTGTGAQRIQFGNATPLLEADEAHANRDLIAPAGGGPNYARNTGVSLNIPANVPTHATNYVSTLTWTFAMAPYVGGVGNHP